MFFALDSVCYSGPRWLRWLRCCATNRKVAGSIPASVIGFFIDIKSFRCVRLTTLPPYCAVVIKSGNLNFLEPCGSLQACNGTAMCYSLAPCVLNVRIRTKPKNTDALFAYKQTLRKLSTCSCLVNRIQNKNRP